MTTAEQSKFTLFANLDYVSVGEMRTNSHALLLEVRHDPFYASLHGGSPSAARIELRGFATDPAVPTFDLGLRSAEFTLRGAESKAKFIGNDGKVTPLANGAVLQFKDGPAVQLFACDSERPIDVEHFEGDIRHVWAVLALKVAKYWRHPRMPLPQWYEPSHIRQAIERGGPEALYRQ